MSANIIPVLLLSFESQTIVFQLFDFHLRKFKKFIIKKFYFRNQTCQHSTWQWLVVGEDNWAGSDPHRFPLFTEIGRIFHHKYISLVIKMLSKLKSGKCWTRLASYPLQHGNWSDLDECRFARLHLRRMELANIQNPRKGDFRAGVTENPQKFPGEQEFPQYYFPRQF